MTGATTAPRVRRIAHPGRLVVVGVLILALLAGAFVAGRLYPGESGPDPVAVSAPIDVWATAERRTLDTSTSFPGTTEEGETRPVAITSEGPAVVLRAAVEPEDRVVPGDLAGEVSGVTYLFLGEPLALYRDLTEGDRGEDVASLQRAVKAAGHWTPTDGRFDARTAKGLRALFSAADAPLPSSDPVSVRASQFIGIPADGARVTSAAEYGDTLSEEVPLMTLTTSAPSVRFTADAVHGADLTEGQTVRITSSAGTVDGTVREVGDFVAGAEGTASGHPVVVDFDADADAAPPVGQSVSVSTVAGAGAEELLTVPQTAVRADGAGQFVVVQGAGAPSGSSSTAPAERRVPVKVTGTGGGYAAVEGDLAAGDRVKVS